MPLLQDLSYEKALEFQDVPAEGGGKFMQSTIFVMLLALAALVFYVLYRVIRAGVRDGILEAGKKNREA